ncbi:MAG: CapA family protein, partial [Bacteroidia bacterium]
KKKPILPFIPGQDSAKLITLSLVGDLMCHKPQSSNAKKADGTYDFNPCFAYVKPYLSKADLTIGNLETTFGGPQLPYAGYPAFNSPDDYAKALKENGFDFLCTANNHSMDTGEEGILRTLEIVKKNGLGYTGTFTSGADHDSLRILTIKGIKLGILNYTYGTNGSYPKSEHKYMLNVIDSATITDEVSRIKQAGAELVLVFYHFGVENAAEPTQAQKDAVKFAWQAGAQLIIGAHPHVIGPTKWLAPYGTNRDSSFVAYSLGNFISNQYWRYTDAGVILSLNIQKSADGRISVKSASYLPTWVYRAEKPAMKQHIVLPCELANDKDKLPGFIDSSLIKKMAEAAEDTKIIMTKYGGGLSLTPLDK